MILSYGLLSALVLLSSLVSLLQSPTANAISDWDNVNLTSDFTAVSSDGVYSTDVTTRWIGIINGTDTTDVFSNALSTAQKDRITDLTNGDVDGYWGVSRQSYGSDGYVINVYWTSDTSRSIDAYGTSPDQNFANNNTDCSNTTVYADDDDTGVGIWLHTDGLIRVVKANSTQGMGCEIAYTSDRVSTPNFWAIFTTYPVNYPAGYDGDNIPGDFIIPGVVFPQIEYTVSGTTITARYIGPSCIPAGSGDPNPSACYVFNLAWTLYDNDGNIIDQKTSTATDTYTFTASDYDHYDLSVGFLNKGVPFANFLPNDYIDVLTAYIEMYVDGSNSFTANNLNCVVDDTRCISPEVTPYEDCSTYGTDIVGGLGCVINNFGIFLRGMLITLFVPPQQFFTEWSDQFGQFLNEKLGFISYAVLYINTFMSQIINGMFAPACTFTAPGELFGAPFSIDVCTFEYLSTGVWTLMQSLIIGLTAIALIFAGLRKYNEVVDQR